MDNHPPDTYLTIKAGTLAEGLYKEKGSKFMAFACHVTAEEAVKEFVEKLKKEYYDARHHCYAFVLGRDSSITRANDDGEPHNTAGIPILNQLKAHSLTDSAVVVVRYFGGVKLGAAGLVSAYRAAAADALSQAQTEEITLKKTLKATFGFGLMNEVMRIGKEFGLDMGQQAYGYDGTCTITLEIREKLFETVKSRLEQLYGLAIDE